MRDFKVRLKCKPVLDKKFIPAVLWNRAFKKAVKESNGQEDLIVALERPNGSVSTFITQVLPHKNENIPLNIRYVERVVKSLLWMRGGYKVYIAANREIGSSIAEIYSVAGDRSFDNGIMGRKIYGKKFEVISCSLSEAPGAKEVSVKLGGNLDGCRIGFDLGGSDRKCAAVIDGEVVFSEEVPWDPYFRKDPKWHKKGILDTLERAAARLPRVDSIGGSSAGVYVNNQVRVASLFRGVSQEDFNKHVINMFREIQNEWNVPFTIVNDGEVTALAGAMSINDTAILGISMGTSEAAGYVDPDGHITDWLNELAFVPVNFREDAPVDEWSGDRGCGVQYFSQQAVARLAPVAGIEFTDDIPFPERLKEVQKLMALGDVRAKKVYETIGTCFGYAIAHYAEFYEIRNLLILGRVTSGKGGDLILSVAGDVLKTEFPELAESIAFHTPDEKGKRHGQAVAAASLPSLNREQGLNTLRKAG
jgi:predicted NBD/HSP70 family sugar kinase